MRKRNSIDLPHHQLLEPEIKSNVDHMAEIIRLFCQLDSTTDKIDDKVGAILKIKQTQFVNSYQQHMLKIKQEFQMLKLQIELKNKKIQMYQSSGEYASLIKRVRFLEEQQKKLLNAIQIKNARIKQLTIQKSINKSQNKRLEDRVKEMIRDRAKSKDFFQSPQKKLESIQTFTTQISPQLEPIDYTRIIKQSKLKRAKKQKSQKGNLTINPQITEFKGSALQKQLHVLQKQNKKLAVALNKINSQIQQSQRFFVNIVAEMKKNITIRKKIKQCSYQDFLKEDKIQLLIKILSNDDILLHLHNKIFGTHHHSMLSQDLMQIAKKKSEKQYAKAHFPSLNSTRLL